MIKKFINNFLINREIKRLTKLTQIINWDADQAYPIPQTTWDKVKKYTKHFNDLYEMDEPRISPCGDGDVYLYYHTLKECFTIIVQPHKEALISVHNGKERVYCNYIIL